MDALALRREALIRHRISTAPGMLFSADRRFVHHLRLNVSAASDEGGQFDDALRVLGRLAAEQVG